MALPRLLLALARTIVNRFAAAARHELAFRILGAELLHHAALHTPFWSFNLLGSGFGRRERDFVELDVVFEVAHRVVKQIRQHHRRRLAVQVTGEATHAAASAQFADRLALEHVLEVEDPPTQNQRRRPDGDTRDVFCSGGAKGFLLQIECLYAPKNKTSESSNR